VALDAGIGPFLGIGSRLDCRGDTDIILIDRVGGLGGASAGHACESQQQQGKFIFQFSGRRRGIASGGWLTLLFVMARRAADGLSGILLKRIPNIDIPQSRP
jgi:hypothetical protein